MSDGTMRVMNACVQESFHSWLKNAYLLPGWRKTAKRRLPLATVVGHILGAVMRKAACLTEVDDLARSHREARRKVDRQLDRLSGNVQFFLSEDVRACVRMG